MRSLQSINFQLKRVVKWSWALVRWLPWQEAMKSPPLLQREKRKIKFVHRSETTSVPPNTQTHHTHVLRWRSWMGNMQKWHNTGKSICLSTPPCMKELCVKLSAKVIYYATVKCLSLERWRIAFCLTTQGQILNHPKNNKERAIVLRSQYIFQQCAFHQCEVSLEQRDSFRNIWCSCLFHASVGLWLWQVAPM